MAVASPPSTANATHPAITPVVSARRGDNPINAVMTKMSLVGIQHGSTADCKLCDLLKCRQGDPKCCDDNLNVAMINQNVAVGIGMVNGDYRHLHIRKRAAHGCIACTSAHTVARARACACARACAQACMHTHAQGTLGIVLIVAPTAATSLWGQLVPPTAAPTAALFHRPRHRPGFAGFCL